MHFLSSNSLRQIENAFADILQDQTVKRGESRLKQLRQLNDYEILLSTFLSRTQVYNLRLLAVLELEKIGTLNQVQSVWPLKTIYYSDSDRMATIVRRLVTKVENIKRAGEFLQCNYDNMGMVETVRLIEFIFRLLDNPEKSKHTISCHFNSLYDCLWKVLQLVKNNYEVTLLVFICIGLLYESCLLQTIDAHFQYQRSNLTQQLNKLWQRVRYQWDCNIGLIPLLVKVIEHILCNDNKAINSDSLFSLLLKQSLKQFRTNNTFRQRYLVVMLQLVMRNTIVFPSLSEIFCLVSVLQQESRVKNQHILISLNLTGQIWQDLGSNQFDSQNQEQMRRLVNGLIEYVLQNHYEEIVKVYQSEGLNEIQIHIQLLPLISHYTYGSCSTQIQRLIPAMISSIIAQLQNYVSDCKLNSVHQKELIDCIGFAEFTIKFKQNVQIELLPHLACLFGQVACQYPNLSSLCYSLFDHLWESLAFLPLNNLADFMVRHVNNLNKNEWGHQLKNYSCFLQLAGYLQKSYQYFSHAPGSDELLTSTISAHQIMLQMLQENSSLSLDFDLIFQMIYLTSHILANRSVFNLEEAHQRLSINYIVCLIDRYCLFSREAAKVVAAHHYVTGSLMNNLVQDSKSWQINLKDFVFRMQVYYSELEYVSSHLSMEKLMLSRKSLLIKINEFCCSGSYLLEQPNQQILELKSRINQDLFSD